MATPARLGHAHHPVDGEVCEGCQHQPGRVHTHGRGGWVHADVVVAEQLGDRRADLSADLGERGFGCHQLESNMREVGSTDPSRRLERGNWGRGSLAHPTAKQSPQPPVSS
jgi:hypothetical protein